MCFILLLVSGVFAGLIYCYFFFFKQKTAYEMRISDWSSDVCSSDLRSMPVVAGHYKVPAARRKAFVEAHPDLIRRARAYPGCLDLSISEDPVDPSHVNRSEERRVGKECVSTCRSRWSPCH